MNKQEAIIIKNFVREFLKFRNTECRKIYHEKRAKKNYYKFYYVYSFNNELKKEITELFKNYDVEIRENNILVFYINEIEGDKK